MALLALGRARGVASGPPILGRAVLAGVAVPIDILDTFGVAVLAVNLMDAVRVPDRADPSCFAVIPRYLLAREPAVILLAAMAAFELVLLPRGVLIGPSPPSGKGCSSLKSLVVAPLAEVDTVRALPGVADAGRIALSKRGVSRPVEVWNAMEVCER